MIFTKEQAEAFESFTWNPPKETREAYKELVALGAKIKAERAEENDAEAVADGR
jgi:hypothetical protein